MILKLLVTGSTGQVGEALCSLVAAEGIECRGLPFKSLDITRESKVYRALRRAKPDYVINAAGYTDVEAAESEADACYAVNREGAFHIAKACARLKIPVIHLSSSYVFDGIKAGPYVESDPCNPQNIYGRSKVQGEHALKSALDEHIVLRTGPVFSEWGDNFLKSVLAISDKQHQENYIDDQLFAPTSAHDVARVIIAILRQLDCGVSAWGTYHYSSLESTSWHGFAHDIVKELSKYKSVTLSDLLPVRSAQYNHRASRPLNTILNCDKILETFGVRQRSWLPEASRIVRLCSQN